MATRTQGYGCPRTRPGNTGGEKRGKRVTAPQTLSNHESEEDPMDRPTTTLTPHPENKKIYGESADAAFLQSVAAKGVLVPLVITYDNRIISGHRRWAAAQAVKLAAVPVSVFRSHDELDILEALIDANRQRVKTNEQVGREAAAL